MNELPFEKIEEKQKQFIVHYPPDVIFDVSRKSFHYVDEIMTSAIDQIARKMAEDADMYIICEMAKRWLEDQKPHEWIKGREIAREMLANETLHIDYENFTCSNCGLVLDRLLYHVDGSPFYNFCPNCGARMKGTETKEGDEK